RGEIAFVGSLLYGFAPYHFLDLYVRGDIAEITAFVFIPIVFLCIEKVIQQEVKTTPLIQRIRQNSKYLIGGGICYALLILSHNGVSLQFSPVFLLYSYLRNKN